MYITKLYVLYNSTLYIVNRIPQYVLYTNALYIFYYNAQQIVDINKLYILYSTTQNIMISDKPYMGLITRNVNLLYLKYLSLLHICTSEYVEKGVHSPFVLVSFQ